MSSLLFAIVTALPIPAAQAGPSYADLKALFDKAQKPSFAALGVEQLWGGKVVDRYQREAGAMVAIFTKQDALGSVQYYVVPDQAKDPDTFLSASDTAVEEYFHYSKISHVHLFTPVSMAADPLVGSLEFFYRVALNGKMIPFVHLALRSTHAPDGTPLYLIASRCLAKAPQVCQSAITGNTYPSGELMQIAYYWKRKL